MSELITRNRLTGRFGAITRWGPLAFVGGGLLWLVAVIVLLPVFPACWFSFGVFAGGLSFAVGLGGLYSEVAGDTPRVALVGGALAAVAALGFAVEAVTTTGAYLAGTPAAPIEAATGLDPLPVAYWSLDVSLLLAGIVALRTGIASRSASLLLVAAPVSIRGPQLLSRLPVVLPDELYPNGFIVGAILLVVAGVLLDTERVVADGWVPPRPETVDGWKQHVRHGDEIDPTDLQGLGFRGISLRLVTNLQISRMGYEMLGPLFDAMFILRTVLPVLAPTRPTVWAGVGRRTEYRPGGVHQGGRQRPRSQGRRVSVLAARRRHLLRMVFVCLLRTNDPGGVPRLGGGRHRLSIARRRWPGDTGQRSSDARPGGKDGLNSHES